MKKLSILLTATLFLIISSCGGSAEQKEDAKDETKKETKKLSKSTKEGMMAILDASGIEVPEELQYESVKKKTDSYVITFIKEDVDEETMLKLEEWFTNHINKLVDDGWKKMVVRDNETIFGVTINEIIMYPPKDKKIRVTYGLTISSSKDPENKNYKYFVKAN